MVCQQSEKQQSESNLKWIECAKYMKKGKIEKVLHEFKEGELHSGSKEGPKVKNRKQAIAIALSEARRGKK
jgi:hypothetical protein